MPACRIFKTSSTAAGRWNAQGFRIRLLVLLHPARRRSTKFDAHPSGCYHRTAGWSSLVARWAHNPKVGGSNPPPATNICNHLGALFLSALSKLSVNCPYSQAQKWPDILMRDDFSEEVKRTLAARVNYFCSNPDCRAQTTGPQVDPSKVLNVGVAAHITAASDGGP